MAVFVFWSGCQSLREAESGVRLRALEMKSCVNERGTLIKPEYLNDCRKTKSTVRQMPKAGLFAGAVPRADFSPAISVSTVQNDKMR